MAEGLVLDLELLGGKKLIKSMRPEMYLEPLSAEIKAITIRAQKTARSGFDNTFFTAARDSIQTNIKPLQGRMFSIMRDNRTASIEHGREPGDPLLHTRALRGWAGRGATRETLFEIARAIQRRGVKGRFFMKAAADEANKGLGRSMDRIATIVVKGFPKFK